MRGHAVTRGPILPPPPPIFPPNLHRSRKRTKKRRGGASDLFFFFFFFFFFFWVPNSFFFFFFFFFIFCIEIRIRVSIISVFQFRDLCHERPDSLDIAISRNWREKYIFNGKAWNGNFCDEEIEETFFRSLLRLEKEKENSWKED